MDFAEHVGKRVQQICEEIAANNLDIPAEQQERRMSSEDFGWYLTKASGALFRFGTRNEEKGCTTVAHNIDFLMNEDGMKFAIKTFCVCILNSGNYL